jgi:tetratricopeptide (TPR) repeat protein
MAVALPVFLMAEPSAAQATARVVRGAPEVREIDAREHFERALELYRAGRYAEALARLESAAELDPNGKDLFFNLSLVHEKLGQLPRAELPAGARPTAASEPADGRVAGHGVSCGGVADRGRGVRGQGPLR